MSSISSSSLRRNWKHDVFPSFHGADVRKSFLSHILKELRNKGIDSFNDNGIVRGEFIGPALVEAIKGSRIAILLLSKRYASSSWCLDELAEIMKCKEESGQTVLAIFYEVDPTDVKKQTGGFGEVFTETCEGKTAEDIEKWSQALAKVATIAGYHSSNWFTETEMIEDIATDVSKLLIDSTPSRDFDGFIGMRSHMEKIEPLLRLESDEVRMIGIWGPPGIGKTTIARCLFNQLTKPGNNFQHSVFMANIRTAYTIPVCSDDYTAKVDLQQKFLTQIINSDIKVTHLGVAHQRLKDKKVLVVLDDVHRPLQLQAMAKDTLWFGPGSLIIITTQDQNLLKAHGINHIYKVGVPTQSLQIFCMYAFEQNSPKDGFEKLAWEVTVLAGQLPLALRVIGSYFRGKCKKKWKNALPELRSRLDGDIASALKFSYDALCEKDKSLFLHLTCYFNFGRVENIEIYLLKTFPNLTQGMENLVDKSLISIVSGYLEINSMLIQLGREIVLRKYGGSEPSIREPGKRQFLVDDRDACEVLTDDAGGKSVIGISLSLSKIEKEEIYIGERAFEKMTNLQFLRIGGDCSRVYFPPSFNYLSRRLILLAWDQFPMTCLPSNYNPQSLVVLSMLESKLKKLWDGNKPLRNLKIMTLGATDLKELPDLSSATNLETLDLRDCSGLLKLPDLPIATSLKTLHLDRCSSLVELPSSLGNASNLMTLSLNYCSSLVQLSIVGNATNLTDLFLQGCSSLVELPSSIGNATNLKKLVLKDCSNLVELPFSIGNLHKLLKLIMEGCSKLEVLPTNINLESLEELYLQNCSLLKTFPEISTNIKLLHLTRTAVEEVPLGIRSWSRLEELHMSYCENLKDSPHALDSITDLHLTDTEIQELGPWIKGFSRLRRLLLNGSQKLVSLPQLPDSLLFLDAENCGSLERLDGSFCNPDISLNFYNCFKLNKEAKDLIIQASNRPIAVVPGGEVPAYFSDRATGSTVTVKLNERPPHKPLRFKACVMLVDNVDNPPCGGTYSMYLQCKIMDKQNGVIVPCLRPGFLHLPCAVTFVGHLYTFNLEVDVTSNELCFELTVYCKEWDVKECGVLQLS
ncbi:unnamed protein product [Arabidopsis thaliana]|uniref:ADP-ribosyl cyclase/cyclic ADP-ribose hydrolase n=1 Tax=Arabidopsis thaliana TaxID=3702 RepID=A0A654F3V6_ARATH|nr:unnamed protein product [Arabidopsis thaliana]